MEGMQAYGAGKAGGGAFDPVTFLQQPQTILRIVSWVRKQSCRGHNLNSISTTSLPYLLFSLLTKTNMHKLLYNFIYIFGNYHLNLNLVIIII